MAGGHVKHERDAQQRKRLRRDGRKHEFESEGMRSRPTERGAGCRFYMWRHDI